MHFKYCCQQIVFCSFVENNVSDAYMLSACFEKQHINVLNPIITYTLFFITDGLTSTRKRHLDLHDMNTEDQLSQHKAWEPILFQPWMLASNATPKIQRSRMIVVICNSQKAFRNNESKYLWNVLMFCMQRAQLYCRTNTKKTIESSY